MADLRNIDYGMKRYVLQSCCLDNHISCTTSGSENGGLHKPNALCTQRVALKKEFPDWLEKKLARIQQCSIKVLRVLMPWKGATEKFTDSLSPLQQIFLTVLLIGLGGVRLWALFAAEFSLELYYLRTKVYLSQVAFARIRQSMALQTASFQATLGRRPFRTEMVAKEWLTYQTDTFQVTI